ncbi:hypothetical protein DYB26_008446, partial [Aphanomyces astaci]
MVIHIPISESTSKSDLAAWCTHHRLLHLLCDSHEQVIRRSCELLRFLCDADAFSLADLHVVWHAVQSNGLDVRASWLFVLEALASYMTVPVCWALLRLIQDLGVSSVSMLGLLGALAKYAPLDSYDDDIEGRAADDLLFATPNVFVERCSVRHAAMQLLWATMEDTTDVAKRMLYDTAKTQLQDAIKANVDDLLDDDSSEKWTPPVVLGCVSYLLELAVHSLTRHRNVPQAFGIVGFILTLFEDATAKRDAIAAALEARGVLQLVLDDLVQFKASYAPDNRDGSYRVDVAADGAGLAGLNARLLADGSHVDFVDHIKARLGFLSLWLNIQPTLAWRFDQLRLLWTELNEYATLGTERTMLFKWLTTNALHWNASTVSFVFQELLGNEVFLTSGALSPLSLQCFLCYFRLTNHHHGLLTLDHVAGTPTSQNQFAIHHLPLMGTSMLWTVLLRGRPTSHSHVVFVQTIKFLMLLPFKLDPELPPLNLVADGLDYLEQATDASVRSRCLTVLASIIGTDEASAAALATGDWVPHGKASRGPPLHLTVNNSIKLTATTGQRLPLDVYAHDTVLEMQVAVARKLDTAPLSTKGLRFFRMGSEIHELSRCVTLADAGFRDGDTVLVVSRPNIPLAPSIPRPAVVFEPRLVDVLMSLIREHDAKEAWDLLMRLPTPAAVVDAIRTHADTWSSSLLVASVPHGSHTQLLYRLQVLDNLIHDDNATGEAMLTTFVLTDGPACIVDLFLANSRRHEEEDEGRSFRTYLRHQVTMGCLRLLVTILAHAPTYKDYVVPKTVEFDPEHVNMDIPVVVELVLSPYRDPTTSPFVPTSMGQTTGDATSQAAAAVQDHVAALIASIDYTSLHAACCRLLTDVLQAASSSDMAIEAGLRLYLICASYSRLFETLPVDIIRMMFTSTSRRVRHLITHALLVLSFARDSIELDPVRCGVVAQQLVQLETSGQPPLPLRYSTLLGLFLYTWQAHPTPQALLDAHVTALQTHTSKSSAFLTDASTSLFSTNDADPVLGELFILRCLVAGFPALQTFQPNLLLEVWHTCLMSYPSTTNESWHPRCTSATSRQAAFRLVVDLSTYPSRSADVTNGNFAFVVQQLARLVLESPVKPFYDDWEWSWDPHLQMKASYVGLRNLGCTCYLNSTLQQLYMTPSIRRAVLTMPISEADSPVFAHIQRLFATLQESQLKHVDPSHLLACLTDETGAGPLNVMVQQDAEEFLTKFCDGLSEYLTQCDGANPPLFGGTVCTQLVCQGGCHSIRETAATSFVCMTVEVKGHDSLVHSLQTWSDGEVLSGVNCDMCGTKQDTMKRDCLDQLPETLLLHLKRFELNFDTFLREKVNDEFRFPLKLDMFPYTKAGLLQSEHERDDVAAAAHDDAMYDLVGCVVHMGSTESGHYYSLVQDRSNGEWVEFNDEQVTKFDLGQLETECFGGADKGHSTNSCDRDPYARSSPLNSKSAYILVYERRHADDLAPTAAAVPPPSSVMADLAAENQAFVQSCYAHEQEFLACVCTLLEQFPTVSQPLAEDMAQWTFLMSAVRCIPLYARAFTVAPLPLLSLVANHVACPTFAGAVLGQFVQHNLAELLDVLLHCTKPSVRVEFSTLLVHLCTLVLENDLAALQADSAAATSTSVIGRLVDAMHLFGMLDDVASHWRHMNEWMGVLAGLAELHPAVRNLLRARKCGMYLLDLYLGDQSPLMGNQYAAYSRKRLPKVLPPSALVRPLSIVARLYRDQVYTAVDSETRSCLLLKTLYVKMFSHADHAKALADLLVSWSCDWEAYTTSVINVVGDVVGHLNPYGTTTAGLVYVLDGFLGLSDSLQETRVSQWFDVMAKHMDGLKSAQAQAQVVGVMLWLGTRHVHVQTCLKLHLESWGPSAGSVVALMAKQPWALVVELADQSTVEWSHAKSLERMTEMLLEYDLGLGWLE